MTVHMESRMSGIRTVAETVFATLVSLSLLGSLAAMLAWSQSWITPMWLVYLRFSATLLGLLLWDRKDIGFGILSAYLALVILRLLLLSPEQLFMTKVSQTIFNGAWAFIGCYSLGHILGAKRTERFLVIFLTGWVFCMACYCGTALYAVWTDQKIWNIGKGGFWGLTAIVGKNASRLSMLFDSNTSGVLCGIAVTAAFLCAAGCRNRCLKGLHILLFLPNWIALSLTDSRTAQIGAAAGIGTAVGILILRTILRKRTGGKAGAAWLAAAGSSLAIAAVCLFLMSGTTSVFNVVKTMRGGWLSGAAAEGSQEIRVHVEPNEVKAGRGETVVLKAAAEGGANVIRYQWQYSEDGEAWIDLDGESATAESLRIKAVSSVYQRRYRCMVVTENETVFSDDAVILKPYTVKMTMKTKSSSGTDNVLMAIQTEGAEGRITYQWQIGEEDGETWTDLPGSTQNTLTVEVNGDKRYRCIVTAGNGIVYSRVRWIRQPSGTEVKTRGLDTEDPLNGRTRIWKQAVRFLADHPKTLLAGRSVNETMKYTGIMRTETIVTEHCHNMFLQTVMESGIPGLLLMLAFMFCTVRRAIRLVTAGDFPALLRLVPAAVCALWVGELTECIVRMTNFRVPTLAMLMLYAGVVCALGRRKKVAGDVNL